MDYKKIKDMAMQADLVSSEIVLELLDQNKKYLEALKHIGSNEGYDCCLEAIKEGSIYSHYQDVMNEALKKKE